MPNFHLDSATFRNWLQRYHARFWDRDVADFNRILELYGSITGRRWRNAVGTCERRRDKIRYSSSLELTEWSASGSKQQARSSLRQCCLADFSQGTRVRIRTCICPSSKSHCRTARPHPETVTPTHYHDTRLPDCHLEYPRCHPLQRPHRERPDACTLWHTHGGR